MSYIDPISLRDVLHDYYSKGEIRTLCYDLFIDYDSLGGRGRSENITELVAYAQRHARLEELATYVRKTRPHVSINTTNTPPPQLASPVSSAQQAPPQTNIHVHGNVTGSVLGGGTLTAENIAGGDININANPQDKADFVQQLQELMAFLEKAITDNDFASEEDGQDAVDDLKKAVQEAKKDKPRVKRLQNQLENVSELITSGAKAGTAVLKAAPIIAGLIKAAQVLF